MTKRFTPSGKAFAIAAMLLVGAALAQLTDQTFSVTKCAGTSGKTGDAQTGLGSAGYTAAANQCRLCKADYDNEFEDTLQKTYGLQLRDSVDATIKQYNGDMNTYTNPYVCFENDGKQYQCQFPRKPNCEVYDHFGRCVRCICGYSLRQAAVFTDATTFDCVPNEDYQDYCAVQTQGKDCLACKWNRLFKDDEAFEFYDEPHAMLDFGLYTDSNGKKQCVDNSKGLAGQTSGIANCREYDKANPLRCKECHSRLYDLNTNVEWDANVDPSLTLDFNTRLWPYFWQRKVHFDYYLSYDDVSTKANKCTRYPSGYAGLPSYLRKITYVGGGSDPNANGATMLDGATAKCKDLGWDSSFRVDAVLVTANGYLSNVTDNTLTGELLANQSLHLCAQAIQFCAQYNVRTITGNNDGSKNSENGVTYTGPNFSYLYGDTCKACQGMDADKKSYILTPDQKKCCQWDTQTTAQNDIFKNCFRATADCSKCAVCKDGFFFDNSSPSKCVAITSYNALCTYDQSSQTSSPSCKTCNLPYLYNGNANPTAGNECKAWNAVSNYFYAPWRTKFIEWGCAGYSGTDPKSADCLSQSTGSVIDSVRCTINDGFKLLEIQGSSTVKRCGCETDYASPLNWAYCRDKTNLPTGCATVVSKGSKYCIECQLGYQLLPDGQCVSVATPPDWTNCVSWTSTNNCRLCDTANGYFLDYDTLTCIKGTFKPVSSASTDVAESMAGCLFGKSQGTNKPYDCFQCALGYYLKSDTWGTGTSAATVLTCIPLNYEAQAALKKGEGKKPDADYKLILTTGKWACKKDEVDAFVIDWVQRANAAYNPAFSTNLPGPTPFTFPRTQCRTEIAECDLYDAQATQSCFLCKRKNSRQLAVQEPTKAVGTTAAQAAKCVECSGTNKLVRSIEGKWVCSKSQDDNCLAYQWDTNDYFCAECADTWFLDVNRKCVKTCDTTTKKSLTKKLWNGWKGVDGCVFKDYDKIDTSNLPTSSVSLFAFETATGSAPYTSTKNVITTTVKYTSCEFYRRVSDTVTECVQCDQSTISGNLVAVLAPLLVNAQTSISATTIWYCAVIDTDKNDYWGWQFASTDLNSCDDGTNSGCAKFTSFTRIDTSDPIGQVPKKRALPLGYDAATNAFPCTVSDPYGTNPGQRYTLVLEQGQITGTTAGNIAFQVFPRCVQDTFEELKINQKDAINGIKTIKQTQVKFQDTSKNYFYTPDAISPVKGCASLYEAGATPSETQGISYASDSGSEASGRCCRCQPDLQAYTLSDLKAVVGANFDTDLTASPFAKCNIVYCGRRQYFNSDLTTPINKNCLTSDHTNAVKSSTCVFCEPGFALNLQTATGTCVAIPDLGNNKYVKENFACLQTADGKKCKVCAWPLIPTLTGATAADPVCSWPAWNSIESTNSADQSVFELNKGCSWPYFLNYTGVCQEKPTNCTQVTGTFDYTANGRHFSFYQYADLNGFTWTTLTDKKLYNLDLARGTCKTCVDGQPPQYGVCVPYCSRVQRQWNAKTYRFDVTCCTCKAGYAFIGGSNNCTKCPDNCASCTFDGTTAKCTTCSQGFFLTGTTCSACTKDTGYQCDVYDTTSAQSPVGTAQAVCNCLTCKLDSGDKPNFRFFDTSVTPRICKTKTPITNCILYEAGSTQGCQTCDSSSYLTKNSGDRTQDSCKPYTVTNCATKSPIADRCLSCNDPLYLDADGKCQTGTITNCQRYDQTATPPGSKCLLCSRGSTATTSFALDAEGKNCIQYSTTAAAGQSQPANVKFCFQYDASLNCIKCNNYDESNQDALYVETLSGDVQGIFALVSGETDRSRQCQFMYYCQAAVKSLTTTYDYFYRCTKCLNTITYTKPPNDKQRVVQFVGRDYGKRYYKNEEDSQQLADPSPQCVSLKGLGSNAVEACTSYQLSDTNKPVPALSTTPPNANTYPIATVAKENCLSCLPDYTPEVYLKGTKSGTFCKFQQTACNIAACQQYDINIKYEFLQCFTCNTTYNSNRYVLNSDSQFCDLTTARNETIPAYTPLYTGIDDGIYAKYDPNYKPSGNDARALSFAVLAVLAALFALLA